MLLVHESGEPLSEAVIPSRRLVEEKLLDLPRKISPPPHQAKPSASPVSGISARLRFRPPSHPSA
jgi:hypothetical protein